MVHLTQKVMNFLTIIKENGGKITKKDQKVYSSVGYYIMIQYLKNNGLVEHNGNTNSNQKIWKFTPKGEEITVLIDKIRGVLDGKEGKSSVIE